jgi:hypothetical protein
VLGYGLDDRAFESRKGLGILLFTTVSRPALGPTQPLIQWVPGALFLVVKRPDHEVDHPPPSSVEVKNAWSYTWEFFLWVSGALSLGVKRPRREADHSPPCSAEVKNAWIHTSTPTIRLHGVVLKLKYRHNFTSICSVTFVRKCKHVDGNCFYPPCRISGYLAASVRVSGDLVALKT